MNKSEYADYVRSPWWREIRKLKLDQQPTCERCGFWDEINVHHKTYERLGNESLSDLEVLCKSCHGRHHWDEEIRKSPILADFVDALKGFGNLPGVHKTLHEWNINDYCSNCGADYRTPHPLECVSKRKQELREQARMLGLESHRQE